MSTGTSIIVLAAWIPVAASALSASVTSKGLINSKQHAWVLTLAAMGWEAYLHFT